MTLWFARGREPPSPGNPARDAMQRKRWKKHRLRCMASYATLGAEQPLRAHHQQQRHDGV
jgi:hypothetical protein